jgi:hypothetical protein
MPVMRQLLSERLGPGADLALQAASESLGRHRSYFDLRERLRAMVERPSLAPYRERNLLFIHVPKCGGSSVERQIGLFHGHRSAIYFRHADREAFQQLHKAALVRDPYDRLVSAFHYLKNHTRARRDQRWTREVLGEIPDFAAFLRALEKKPFRRRILRWLHFLPQWYFLCDAKGGILVDHVGRLESIGDFFAHLAARTGLPVENVREKKSVRDPADSYYDTRSRLLVQDMYERDFTIFGYTP